MKLKVMLFLIAGALALIAQEKKQLTVEDIYGSMKFMGKSLRGAQWLPDGSAFTYLERGSDSESKLNNIYRHDIATGEVELIVEGSALGYGGEPVSMSSYEWSPDQKYLLITGPEKQIWRHSREAPFYLLEIEEKKITALANNDSTLQNAKLSPDGSTVAYMLNNNLYVWDIEAGKAEALTSDGSADILNAVFDWVYEEEFGSADAYRWSPDGSKIAFWRLDQTRVKPFHYMLDEMPLYNVVHSVKYPKVGEQNALVQIGVVEVKSGRMKWMDIGNETDIYIPRIDWANSPDKLIIQRLNRKQNKMELLMVDVNSGKSQVIVTDSNPDGWVDVTDDLTILKNSDQFLWTSEQSGYRHIYLYDYSGNLVRQLTSGEWEVSAIDGVDEINGWVYFNAQKETPIENHIYRVKIDGSDMQKISDSPGWHTAEFAPDYRHFIDYASNVSTPTQVLLYKSDGEPVRMLEENRIEALEEYNMVYPEFLTIATTDGTELNAYMIKPADFDPNKKYPVLVFGYGGPGSQMVVNRWGGTRGLWHQMMTEKGYIVFCLDNRGTGGRGKAFKNLAYGDISKWAVHDQIEGAKYLAGLPYVDGDRIGFWGWSGGGYLTCHLLTRGADYFKAGVAVASVTDFRNYDTIWTERYMGLLSENEAGYNSANVLEYAHLLKGKLLLIHGSGDDNVHYQNTVQFAQRLIDEGKQFDLMVYPNKNHRIHGGNTQEHLFTKITNYFLRNL